MTTTTHACDKCKAKMHITWRAEELPVSFSHVCEQCRKSETPAPTYFELLDALQSLAEDCEDYVNEDDRDLPDHGPALAIVQRARAAHPASNFADFEV